MPNKEREREKGEGNKNGEGREAKKGGKQKEPTRTPSVGHGLDQGPNADKPPRRRAAKKNVRAMPCHRIRRRRRVQPEVVHVAGGLRLASSNNDPTIKGKEKAIYNQLLERKQCE